MDLRQYLSVLRKRWITIVVITILGVLLGVFATVFSPRVYEARVQLFVAVGASTESGVAGFSSFALQRMSSYPAVVTSPQVLDPASADLGGVPSPSAIRGMITVSSTPQTVLLNITATGTDPVQLERVANAVAANAAIVIERIETPQGEALSPVKVSVTQPASVPTTPVSPNATVNVALGLVLGLGVGLLVALIREQLDTRVKSSAEIAALTQSTDLGSIPFTSEATRQPIVAFGEHSARGEAYRRIRTNFRFVDVDNPPKVFVITSAVPHEGKTTTACNLAIVSAMAGAKVCLVEADLRAARGAAYLGIESATGLTDVLTGQISLRDVKVPWGRNLLTVIPAGTTPPNPTELLGSAQMEQVLANLRAEYDVVVLDAPPLLSVSDATVLTRAADGAILVFRARKTTREQVERSHKALQTVNARILGTVLNFAPKGDAEAYGYGYGYGYGDHAGRSAKSGVKVRS